MLMIHGHTVSNYKILLQAGTNVYYSQISLGMEKTCECYFYPLSCDNSKFYSLVKFKEKLDEFNCKIRYLKWIEVTILWVSQFSILRASLLYVHREIMAPGETVELNNTCVLLCLCGEPECAPDHSLFRWCMGLQYICEGLKRSSNPAPELQNLHVFFLLNFDT